MEKIVIHGSKPLRGDINVHGSKNASLPMLVATLLTDEPCVIRNVPRLDDVDTILEVLRVMGKRSVRKSGDIHIYPHNGLKTEAPYELVKKMRASVLVIGPMLARKGRLKVSLPGGCAIGARPINLHIENLRRMGVKIGLDRGDISLTAPHLIGQQIYLDFPSVGATENLMMAAVCARGITVIENAAREPEIVDLSHFLSNMGAQIKGAGSSVIEIRGVKKLYGAEHRVIPDRIEAGTFILAAAITRGDVNIKGVCIEHLESLIQKIRQAGVSVTIRNSSLRVHAVHRLKSVDIATNPYPGFPTDLQAPWMSLMCMSKGECTVLENVFENRFLHVGELHRMGAHIRIRGNTAIIKGVEQLSGAPVNATDLRAAAALIVAGLGATKTTEITGVNHLDRGYDNIEGQFRRLGASIKRVRV